MTSQQIAAPPDAVWAVISAPGYLEQCHPFCDKNPVYEWPGTGSHDALTYNNGRRIERRFTAWRDGIGYDLEVSDATGAAASVAWRIDGENSQTTLTISLVPRMLGSLPAVVRWLTGLVVIRPMMRRYLRAVVRGMEWRVVTGESVRRNQFGAHRWFSPAD